MHQVKCNTAKVYSLLKASLLKLWTLDFSKKLEENSKVAKKPTCLTSKTDRLGPGYHESEAKVHTSFPPRVAPANILRGRGYFGVHPLQSKSQNLWLKDTGHSAHD